MSFFDIEVLIAAPAALDALDLCAVLREQTMRPTRITVFVDDKDVRADVDRLEVALIGGVRPWAWAAAGALADPETNRIVVMLAPDARPPRDYIERSVRWLLSTGAAVSWQPFAPVLDATYESVLDVGTTVLWGKWLHGITKAPHQDILDNAPDLYFSWWLWWKGHRIVRPVLALGARSLPSSDATGFDLHRLNAELWAYAPARPVPDELVPR